MQLNMFVFFFNHVLNNWLHQKEREKRNKERLGRRLINYFFKKITLDREWVQCNFVIFLVSSCVLERVITEIQYI